MSAAHTPGPWILMTVPTSVGSCHKIGPFPNGERVSTFACVYADGHRIGVDDANPAAVELAANARLIAAAPELLEALVAALAAMEHMGDVLNSIDAVREEDEEEHSPAFYKARAAIAKATGGAQ